MAKIKFKTIYDEKKEKIFSPSGEKEEVRHEPEMTLDGKRVLKPTRVVPIYEMIQVGREETEVERIVNRAINGDYNALNAIEGVYSDISDAPSSLAEAQQLIINAKREFENLPPEVKKEFEYNPEIYVAQVGTKEWLDKMGISAKFEAMNEEAKKDLQTKENMARAFEQLATSTTTPIKKGVENE